MWAESQTPASARTGAEPRLAPPLWLQQATVARHRGRGRDTTRGGRGWPMAGHLCLAFPTHHDADCFHVEVHDLARVPGSLAVAGDSPTSRAPGTAPGRIPALLHHGRRSPGQAGHRARYNHHARCRTRSRRANLATH